MNILTFNPNDGAKHKTWALPCCWILSVCVCVHVCSMHYASVCLCACWFVFLSPCIARLLFLFCRCIEAVEMLVAQTSRCLWLPFSSRNPFRISVLRPNMFWNKWLMTAFSIPMSCHTIHQTLTVMCVKWHRISNLCKLVRRKCITDIFRADSDQIICTLSWPLPRSLRFHSSVGLSVCLFRRVTHLDDD